MGRKKKKDVIYIKQWNLNLKYQIREHMWEYYDMRTINMEYPDEYTIGIKAILKLIENVYNPKTYMGKTFHFA